MDIEAHAPMRKDTIFPIASMTMPVTGVAILMLVEEGKVRLSDPVSRFIPEFKNTRVAMPRSDAAGEDGAIYTVPATREPCVAVRSGYRPDSCEVRCSPLCGRVPRRERRLAIFPTRGRLNDRAYYVWIDDA